MKRFIKVAALALISLFCLSVILLIDLSPIVAKNAYQQVKNAENVSELIMQLRSSLRNRYQPQQIDISYSQAESLLGFTQRALPNVNSDIKLSEDQAEILISYQLPAYLLSSYVNVSIKVKEASYLDVKSVSIGVITLPGNWVLGWVESLANSYTNSEVATKAIQQVAKTDISPHQVIISLNPLDPLLRELKNIKTSGDGNERQLLIIKTAHYLRLLDSLPLPNNLAMQNKDTSLSYYLHKIMLEAKTMSSQDPLGNSNSATLENEAAIMALAIYVGHRRFSTLFGDLSFAVDPIPTVRKKPVLANRQDLSLHFIFSAAIKLLSEQGISIAVGEFKELMDRGNGGSGYSFIDLTADIAGANFATLAVDPRTAEQIQNIMSLEANESFFFPSIDGFDEGMNKSQFRQKYSDIESKEYLKVLKEIERRVSRLPVSRISN
ncbi:hypothetical protein [Brumicola pallidula]|uniref:Uncharacterized protein n=1 Tax=Brumicola pallidula DSM 14239 = ACAM 615 TaxID=1121922 RepID=K6ZI30_9ALTE|nr:hypothetical protein [Glaciecola pallidula]GAC30007.1 hypothetical protein GPAL_3156 [Glaciecola pallidula DSM 14239 = ACAM 615]